MIQQMSRDLSWSQEDLLWSQVVARAWCDKDFKERLLSDPRNALIEQGMVVPEDMEVEVVEGDEVSVKDSDQVRRFTFTDNPPDELTEEDLVGGTFAQCFSAPCAACGRCGACGCRCSCRCSCRCF
jgi:hypothetical protein